MADLIGKINNLKTELASCQEKEDFPDWEKNLFGCVVEVLNGVNDMFMKIDSIEEIRLDANGLNRINCVNGMDCANIKETKINGTTLNNWKWNYLYDNISNKSNLPNLTKTSSDAVNEAPEHSFYTDFDEFSISLMKKENSDYTEFEIKETDLLELDDSGKTSDIKETSLIGSDDEDIKETDLTGTDDEFTDVSSLSSLTINNGLSMNRLDRSFISLPRDALDDKSDIFDNNDFLSLEETKIVDGGEVNNSKNNQGGLIKFQELESDYFETDCETMDSGIFPHKETEYFQDIGSDFFDDDDDENITHKTTSSITKLKKTKKNEKSGRANELSPTLSPSSPLPPGKTATMSNSLLRSTICELERALGDSNKLLAKRDEKMQTIRSRNIELKKTLSKEVESNTKMKHLLIEKDKVILEKQTKVIALNQEIHEINDKLSKLRLNRLNEIHSSGTSSEKTNPINDSAQSKPCMSTHAQNQKPQTPEKDDAIKSPSTSTPLCKSNKRPSCRQKNMCADTNEVKPNGAAYFPQKDECTINNDNIKTNKDDVKKDGSEKLSSGELQANLRIKFMRDAFFYYMIGFHPDEQINAILAILEYGDRRQDFVLEAHNMKKIGKKFNVSKVSSRGHSFVQEEFQ